MPTIWLPSRMTQTQGSHCTISSFSVLSVSWKWSHHLRGACTNPYIGLRNCSTSSSFMPNA
eukprot:153173-Pyramimonas_sp.AAC.1